MKRLAVISSVGVACVAVAGAVYLAKYEQWVAIPRARAPLLEKLRDPQSAQFRNELISRAGALCGEVNSKNGMGGYVGFKRYISQGSEANYIEDDGPLGEWSTQDIIALTKHETEVLQRFVKYREQIPGLAVPTKEEIAKLARSEFFKQKWAELCATPT